MPCNGFVLIFRLICTVALTMYRKHPQTHVVCINPLQNECKTEWIATLRSVWVWAHKQNRRLVTYMREAFARVYLCVNVVLSLRNADCVIGAWAKYYM